VAVKTYPLPPTQYPGTPQPIKSGGGSALLSLVGGIVPSLIGGLFASNSAKKQNQAQIALAREQMAFQERMSSTAYQRAATDLEKAGLNRVLALGNSASTPGGAMPQLVNEGQPGINSALAIARQMADIKNIEANTEKTGADTKNVQQDTANKWASSFKILEEIDLLQQQGKLAAVNIDIQRAVRSIKGSESVIIKSEEDLWQTIQNLDASEMGALAKMVGPTAAKFLLSILARK